MSLQRPAAAGKLSSEYLKSLRAEIAGAVLIVVGVVLYLVLRDWTFPSALVFAGAHLAAHTSAAYAESRGRVKAADHSPNAVKLPARGV